MVVAVDDLGVGRVSASVVIGHVAILVLRATGASGIVVLRNVRGIVTGVSTWVGMICIKNIIKAILTANPVSYYA